eukprot:TRINITY_DN1188_c0_g1_i1.p1 TRINITY_DN1188_c0_g1~~TRINITY_DN1188_c0_g1_i1.p1  ORF type:complete len:360 (+),score=77.05 TRINITY_DN1188_c0_g1_i1:66-1145(+)
MKLIRKNISAKDGEGSVKLRPEESEDLWHAYHLILPGDLVEATTMRKVQSESATGSAAAEKIRMTLTIEVKKIDFDPQGGMLRLSGQNRTESDYVKLGAFHTLELELNRNFTVHKSKWDAVFLDRLESACDPAHNAEVAAVVMQEGLATICLVTKGMTVMRARIEMPVTRKHKAAQTGSHQKGQEKFYETVMQALLRNVDLVKIKCVLVASPGFVKDQFFEYVYKEAVRKEIRVLIEQKAKFLLVHASSGHKHALQEAMSQPEVQLRLSDTKAAGEVRLLKEFNETMHSNPESAVYGLDYVKYANEQNAIKTLLITDELFRASSVKVRAVYVALVESVRDNGGDVAVFSNLHVSGERMS